MKKIIVLCIIWCICVTQISFLAHGQLVETTDGNSAVSNGYYTVDAGAAMLGADQLVENARAAFLYEANSDTLMYAWKADEQMYPASLVKLMTALIAVEKGNLSDTVTVSEGAVSSVPYNAVSADLLAGEQMRLEDLLYCMLTGSANDAAAVIAEHIGGSQAGFVELMNEYAATLGCTGTYFTNAHGLHDDGQYTTARDVARILDAAVANEAFFAIFSAQNHTVEATNMSEARELTNKNSLMDATNRQYYDSRVVAGRTGVTEDGRRCLAAVSESNGMRLISVVMGAESVYQEDGYTAISIGGYVETSALLDAGFGDYKTAQILYANQALKQSTVVGGDCDVVLGPHTAISVVLPVGVTSADLSMRYSDHSLIAPIEAGERVCDVQVWYGGMCVAQVDLYAMNSVGAVSTVAITDSEQPVDNGFPKGLWVIMIIILAVVIVLIALRLVGRIRFLAIKNRSKRYRRSRRRSR